MPRLTIRPYPLFKPTPTITRTRKCYPLEPETIVLAPIKMGLSSDRMPPFPRMAPSSRTLPFGRTLQWPKTLPYGKMHHSARMPADKTPLMARIAVRMAAKTPPCGPPSPRMPLRTLRFSDKTRARMRPKMGHLDKMPRCTRMPHKTLASCKTPARTPRRMQASSDKMQARMRLCFKMPPKTRL